MKTNGKYILDANGEPIPEPDLETWADWLQTADRTIRRDFIGRVMVSTVFLGIDMGFNTSHPILWETMVFEGPGCHGETQQKRCGGSREQAEAMHAEILAEVQLRLHT